MSKKDKKRIAQLEKTVSNLIRMHVNLRDNYIQRCIEQDKLKAFQAGTISSEKEQPKTEHSDQSQAEKLRQNCVMFGRNWGKSSLHTSLNFLEKAMAEKGQEKPAPPEQSEAEKEQESPKFSTPEMKMVERELMVELHAKLAKFASLEAFNTERANRGLPAIDKLEFDKAKSVFDYALAAAKVLRPQWYDKINQIKIPETEQAQPEHCEAILDDLGYGKTKYDQIKTAQSEQEKPEQIQPENRRENLGEPVLNNAAQFKKGLPKPAQINRISPEECEENIAKEDWESRKQISAEQLSASLSKLASLPLKSEQELAEAKRTNAINATLKMLVEDLAKHLNFTLENYGKDRAKQVEMLQGYCDHFKEDLSDFRRKVLSVSELVGAEQEYPYMCSGEAAIRNAMLNWAEQDNPKQAAPILPAPEQKEAEQDGSELGGTWLIYNKIDKAWAAKCSDGGFYWSSKEDDFVLKFPSEAKAKERYNSLCSRGLISRMHRANSGVIRKEEAAQGGSELGGTDGADSPKEVESWVIEIRKKATREKVGYVWKGSEKTMIVWQNLCDAKRFRSKQSAIDFFAEKFVMTDAVLFHTIVKI